MSADRLALAYWQAVDDLTDLQKAIDREREVKRARLNEIEAMTTEERALLVTEHIQLLREVKVLTATRFEVCNVRALIRTRANECAPDLIGRMARAVTAAAVAGAGCPPCGES